MDPLSALSLAACVVQFVDFAGKLVFETKSVAATGKGISAKNVDLETITRDVVAMNERLTAPTAVGAIPDEVRELASNCKSVAQELLSLLDTIRGKSAPRRWSSFVQALRALISEERTATLMQRVERLREQMHIRLQVTMSEQQSSILSILKTLVDENSRLEADRTRELQSLMAQVRQALVSLDAKTKLNDVRIHELFRAARSFEPVDDNTLNILSENMRNLSDALEGLARESGVVATEQLVLKSLWFSSMTHRQDKAPSAASKTFDWIFGPESVTGFSDWLLAKSGIYWITGKAGSGKTTLMKYLVNNPRTMLSLQKWAEPRRLIMASYFFWNPGSDLQKSQEGLFRTILYEILHHCPELIHPICASKLKNYRPFGSDLEPWTRDQLWEAIEMLSSEADTTTNFCIFIDGLDEYSGPPNDLVKILEDLRTFRSLKLCISSRPLNEYLEAFGQQPDTQLRVEDFTHEDIREYVHQRLEEDRRFKIASASDERYQELVQDIVNAANGVFLWVSLVVHSLLSSLTNRDGIPDLKRRLKELPQTLEEFFQRMLDSVEPFYREKMAKTLMLALYTPIPLTLMIYWIIDEELDQRAFEPLRPLSRHDVESAQEDMRWRVNSRTMGLLEVVDEAQTEYEHASTRSSIDRHTVEFLHRTARDFLLTKYAKDQFRELIPEEFSPALCICAALLAKIKLIGPNFKSEGGLIESLFSNLLYFAEQAQRDTSNPLIELLDEVRRTLAASSLSGPRHIADQFLSHMVGGAQYGYVKHKLRENPESINGHKPPLLALVLLTQWADEDKKIDMIKLLLESGADPNERYSTSTVWGAHLAWLYQRRMARNTIYDQEFYMYQIAKIMARHGANLGIERVVVGQKTVITRQETGRAADLFKRPETKSIPKSGKEILEICFQDGADELLRIRPLRSPKMKKKKSFFSRVLSF